MLINKITHKNSFLFAIILVSAVIVSGCGGSSTYRIRDLNQSEQNHEFGGVFLKLDELGVDIGETGKVATHTLKKILRSKEIKIVSSENKADLVLHGKINISLESSRKRLGLDYHYYKAHATWQISKVDGYSVLLNRETTATGEGAGKYQAITDTLTNLANKMASSALPRLKKELGF